MDLKEIIAEAFKEDQGTGDHTSLSTIPKDAKGSARIIAREQGIISGIDTGCSVFQYYDEHLKLHTFFSDGDTIQKEVAILQVYGNVSSILQAERLALNFMQRMSGIATKTKAYSDAVKGYKARILDTRKTTPLLRELEKKAVHDGGGYNHRMGLYDMIMIKDNHIDFSGGIARAIDAVEQYQKKHKLNLPVEIEVRNFEELNEVMRHGQINRIMLDNFSPEDITIAINIINGKYETEASGGITLETIRDYAATGVDFISVGALTHHIKSLDLSLIADF
ncbi:MAG: carboxylating nicotinate-nucleotide diphosphorylase [Bacteroidales bacterium]|nr:carboxylating nicotinate-nucleotide diphosphorylase [Bacteroidales bacterium]